MNIAYFSGTTIPSKAASALHAVKMAQALAQLGHPTRLYAFRNQKDTSTLDRFYGLTSAFEQTLIKPPPMGFGWGYYFSAACRLNDWRLGPQHSADAFYGRHVHALLMNSRTSKPFAYEAHVLPTSTRAQAMELKLLQRPNLRALVCISEALAHDYEKILPATVPIHVLHDAADAVAPMSTSSPELKEWPGRSSALQVGYVGHLYRGKGMELIRQLAPALPDMEFHIIGGQESDIAHWRSQLQRPNVHFHGFVPHHRLPAYYAAIDVALIPNQAKVAGAASNSEIGRWTSPLKAFEYMAMGLPIVASAIPPLLEIFTTDSNALIAPPDEPQLWVQQLRTLEQDSALRSRLGRRAREDFERLYTWDIRAKKVAELLQ